MQRGAPAFLQPLRTPLIRVQLLRNAAAEVSCPTLCQRPYALDAFFARRYPHAGRSGRLPSADRTEST